MTESEPRDNTTPLAGAASTPETLEKREPDGGISDPDLIAATLAGDDTAFRSLVSRHCGEIYRALRGILRSPSAAEEITQAAFLRAYRYLDRFDRRRAVSPWLLKNAINLALSWMRAEIGGPHATDDPQSSFRRLPPLWRALLGLQAVLDFNYEDLAGNLGLPSDSVLAHLSAARTRLAGRTEPASISAENPECAEIRLWLDAYEDQELATFDRRKVAQHLEGCPACRRISAEITEISAGLRGLLAAEPPASQFCEGLAARFLERQDLAALRGKWRSRPRPWWRRVFGR